MKIEKKSHKLTKTSFENKNNIIYNSQIADKSAFYNA